MKPIFKEKTKINIYDSAFSHLPCSCHDNESKHIEWVRSDSEVVSANVAFYTDTNVHRVKEQGHKYRKNVAWLIEPPSIDARAYEFVRQNKKDFDFILTPQRWFLNEIGNVHGLFAPLGGCWIHKPDRQLYKKSKFCSIIVSDKKLAPGHILRHEVAKQLCEKYGIDVFGRGTPNKLDYILPAYQDYAFQIVIENEKSDDWFTEKLLNCFATGTIPIYYGTSYLYKNEYDLTFDTIDQLETILERFMRTWQRDYLNLKHIAEDNIRLVEKYEVAEDFIFENYPQIFS